MTVARNGFGMFWDATNAPGKTNHQSPVFHPWFQGVGLKALFPRLGRFRVTLKLLTEWSFK